VTIPFLCVLISFLLIFVPKVAATAALVKDKDFDNNHPRAQQATLTGWRMRAMHAHYNGYEAFPAFAAGVLIAHVAHADPKWMTILALTHVGARTLYPVLYIANVAPLRSLTWIVGFSASIGLMALPWWA
jgi:uncharacterized MAPEG superfamily protein